MDFPNSEVTTSSLSVYMIKKVGNNIRKARLQRNVTQEAVAGELGISTHAYGNIERGDADMNMKRLEQIAEVLKTSPEELVKDSDGTYIVSNTNTVVNQGSNNIIGVREETLQTLTDVLKELCGLLKKQ